ncbi:MAG: hypothetical protein PVJ43_13515 [Gemmatimonadales bacterium]
MAVVVAACGGKSRDPEPAEGAATRTGRVRVAGSTPLERVLLEPEEPEATAIEIAGDLRPELKRLTGARVQVTGTTSSSGRLRVSEYAILEISGHKPVVGMLEVEASEASVVDAEGGRWRLRDAPAELMAHDGAKVWVVLNTNGVVTGYGILRER